MDEQQHTQGTQNWLYLKAIANPQIAGNRQANQVIRDYCSLSVVVIVCVSVFCLPVTKVSHYFKSEKKLLLYSYFGRWQFLCHYFAK